jgi:predicted GNAT family N-acyltransferase
MPAVIESTFDKDHQRILKVRYRVFVEEQGVPVELEQDDKDPFCRHALVVLGDQPIATGRLQADGHIGRIAVLPAHRGEGHGRNILVFLEDVARQTGLNRVYLGAQVGAIPFYVKLGYHPYGDRFMEAGIQHQHMEKIFD